MTSSLKNRGNLDRDAKREEDVKIQEGDEHPQAKGKGLEQILPHNCRLTAVRVQNCETIHLIRRADSSEKTLMLGGIGGRRRRGRPRMRWLDDIPTQCT